MYQIDLGCCLVDISWYLGAFSLVENHVYLIDLAKKHENSIQQTNLAVTNWWR